MKKPKPHKASLKRVRVTRNGKVVRKTAGKSKLMSHKSGRRKQRLRRNDLVNNAIADRMKQKMNWFN